MSETECKLTPYFIRRSTLKTSSLWWLIFLQLLLFLFGYKQSIHVNTDEKHVACFMCSGPCGSGWPGWHRSQTRISWQRGRNVIIRAGVSERNVQKLQSIVEEQIHLKFLKWSNEDSGPHVRVSACLPAVQPPNWEHLQSRSVTAATSASVNWTLL